MRLTALSTLFVISIAALCSSAQADDLKHNWRQEESKDSFNLISKYPAPAPFSETGEPEATLTMAISQAPKGMTLADIVNDEITGIRQTLVIADYLDDDGHKPDKGIASYFEEIDGQQVAFIKYRVAGNKKTMLPHPRSATHAILLKKGKVCYVHLFVLYAGHQDEVQHDQIWLVKSLIKQ